MNKTIAVAAVVAFALLACAGPVFAMAAPMDSELDARIGSLEAELAVLAQQNTVSFPPELPKATAPVPAPLTSAEKALLTAPLPIDLAPKKNVPELTASDVKKLEAALGEPKPEPLSKTELSLLARPIAVGEPNPSAPPPKPTAAAAPHPATTNTSASVAPSIAHLLSASTAHSIAAAAMPEPHMKPAVIFGGAAAAPSPAVMQANQITPGILVPPVIDEALLESASKSAARLATSTHALTHAAETSHEEHREHVEAARSVANAYAAMHGLHLDESAAVRARVDAAERASNLVALISVAEERANQAPAGPERVAAIRALLAHCHETLDAIRGMKALQQ